MLSRWKAQNMIKFMAIYSILRGSLV